MKAEPKEGDVDLSEIHYCSLKPRVLRQMKVRPGPDVASLSLPLATQAVQFEFAGMTLPPKDWE
jgi:hypothetical protein